MKATVEILPGAGPMEHKGSETGILMLHGFTGTPAQYVEFFRYFKEQGYTVRVPLLDGHGTNARQLNQCVWKGWYNTVKTNLFEMRAHCKRIFIIGQSMGGTLALHLAAHYLVEGIVLLAPAMVFKSRLTSLTPFVSPLKGSWKKKDGPDIQNLKGRNEEISYDVIPLRALNELRKMIKHVWDDLQDVHIPVLIAHSKHDNTIDFKGSRQVYDKISSRNKRFLELKNSFHILTLDNDKDVVLRESESFIQKLSMSTGAKQLD